MSDREEDVTIASSKLGTKEYWDAHYATELANFLTDGDEGDVWFGARAELGAIGYIASLPPPLHVADLGCGNGHFLRQLRSRAARNLASLTGLDYAPAAIKLCEQIEAEDPLDDNLKIEYRTFDILDPSSCERTLSDVDVLHDKGTWDALSLSPDRPARLQAYRKTVQTLLRPGAIFIITSCNYTVAELKGFFAEHEEFPLTFQQEIANPAPAFSFGGKTGTTFTTVVFTKKA